MAQAVEDNEEAQAVEEQPQQKKPRAESPRATNGTSRRQKCSTTCITSATTIS